MDATTATSGEMRRKKHEKQELKTKKKKEEAQATAKELGSRTDEGPTESRERHIEKDRVDRVMDRNRGGNSDPLVSAKAKRGACIPCEGSSRWKPQSDRYLCGSRCDAFDPSLAEE